LILAFAYACLLNWCVPESCVVGVDLGGTNVRACTYSMDGREAGVKFSNPSNARKGVEAVADAVAATIIEACESSAGQVLAVGMGIPGHIDDERGLVRWAPNFLMQADDSQAIWRDVPLKRLIEDRVRLPLHTGNDANVAALGEYRFGSGRNSARCLVMITLGTGVGGGVAFSPAAVQGKASGPLLLLGGNKGGAELGHVCVDPVSPSFGPGARGSLESFCGAYGIIGRAAAKLKGGRESTLTAKLAEGGISTFDIFQAAEQDDRVALEVWKEMGEFLGLGLGSFVNLFAPDVIAVGGQIARAHRYFLPAALQKTREVAIPTLMEDARIGIADREEDAGLLGAAALAWEALK
jgi:glucokinase